MKMKIRGSGYNWSVCLFYVVYKSFSLSNHRNSIIVLSHNIDLKLYWNHLMYLEHEGIWSNCRARFLRIIFWYHKEIQENPWSEVIFLYVFQMSKTAVSWEDAKKLIIVCPEQESSLNKYVDCKNAWYTTILLFIFCRIQELLVC